MPRPLQGRFRDARLLAEAAALAFVLLATLRPEGEQPGPGWLLCFWCGDEPLSQVLQNILLFVPLGVTLWWRGLPRATGILLGAAVSLTVETLQLWIPGRTPSLGDLVYNTVGTGLGWHVAVMAWHGLALPPARAARRSLIAVATAAGVLAATGALLRPAAVPTGTSPWRLRLPRHTTFRGEILAVRLGSLPLAPGRLPPGAADQWAAGAPLFVTLVPGVPRAAYAPALTIEDNRRRPWLSLGFGRDVVLWNRTRATALWLDEPDLRWPGALRDLSPRDTVTLTFDRGGARHCLTVTTHPTHPTHRHCTAYDLGSGWTMVQYPEGLPRWARRALSAAWLAGLFFPAGVWARRRWATAVAAIVGIAAITIVPRWWHLLPLQPHELAGTIAGLAAGHLTARAVARRRFTPP